MYVGGKCRKWMDLYSQRGTTPSKLTQSDDTQT